MKNVSIELRVNGEAVEVSFDPAKTLLEVLREDLALTGTKHGCELGECGACAVLPQLAAVLGPGEREVLAQHLEQGLRGIERDLDGLAVHAELDRNVLHLMSPRTR